jgi:formylmethanofuran--tetrahydromethanopterin N-formyltransferase
LPASTNHLFCPAIKDKVKETLLPKNVNCVYEIVINGLTLDDIKKAMAEGIKAAIKVPGVVRITAANYGGKLGPYKAFLKEILS